MPVQYIGCCGAFCKTCPEYVNSNCKGCKLGYDDGKRDINKARCKIKLCCFRDKQLSTCVDCAELDTCNVIQSWFSKNGYKYRKYQESIKFIRQFGYDRFLVFANSWKRHYGKLDWDPEQ